MAVGAEVVHQAGCAVAVRAVHFIDVIRLVGLGLCVRDNARAAAISAKIGDEAGGAAPVRRLR